MKVSAAALPFLILAATLGPLALGLPVQVDLGDGSLLMNHGLHHPGDCCFSYTPRNIRCEFMKHYFLTTSGCTQPAVIFITKRGQEVCAHPSADGVQACVEKLASALTDMEVR